MYSVLLAVIYLAFICLGLPDSLLGSGWPVMYGRLGVPVSYAGILAMIISCGTIVSSLLSDRLKRSLGAGLVTALSVLMTAAALFGFSTSGSFALLCLWAIPYGLGAGAVDAVLNNFVALHYSSRHMSWLHCSWGIGVSISPFIMSYCLTGGLGWQAGYRFVFIIQIVFTAILFLSLPLWTAKEKVNRQVIIASDLGFWRTLRLPGVKYVLLTFFGYCALEATAGLWASSYLVLHRGIDEQTSARFASLFYLGITCGRFLSGFAASKVGDKNLVRLGLGVTGLGILAVLIQFGTHKIALAGLVIIGLGCAPIYPSLIHATPDSFGKENSQAIIGIQMASAYTGGTFIPPVFGAIANNIDIAWYPGFLAVFFVLMVLMSEKLNRRLAKSG